jgi:hypothetical protein
MDTLRDLQIARNDIWNRMPEEVKKLFLNHQIMQPAGRTIYAEAETRLLTELIHVFLNSVENRDLDGKNASKVLALLLTHFADRLGGWYGLKESAALTLKVQKVISNGEWQAFSDIIRELSLYMSKLNLWIDLLIPWNDINELMRRWENDNI